MSKTLEERVAALEDAVFGSGQDWSTKEDIEHFIHDGIPAGRKRIAIPVVASLSEMAASAKATSDPQEPYCLDTKPQPKKLMDIDIESRVILGDTGSRVHASHGVPGVWNIEFDPKASHKGIPFSVALEYMKAGRRVRRGSRSIWMCDGVMIGDGMFAYSRMGITGATGVDKNDIIANDWEVVEP